MRASLKQARKVSEIQLKRLVRSPKATHSAGAYDLVKAIALSALPDTMASVQDWDHANASYRLSAPEAPKEACVLQRNATGGSYCLCYRIRGLS